MTCSPAFAVPRPPTSRFGLRVESDELLHMDFMRFVAAMGIVACHSLEFTVPLADRPALNLRAGGLALFVEFFFIISGFVITWVYAERLRTSRDFGRFMQRRVGRLLPLHLLTLVAAFVLWAGVAAMEISTNTAPDLSASCMAKAAFLLHGIFSCDGSAPNGQSWSISAEMLAYFLFPLFLAIMLRGWTLLLLAAIAVTVALVLQMNGAETAIRVIPTFLTGMLCYRYRATLARLPFATEGVLFFTVAFLVACAITAPQAVLLALIFAAAICTIAADMRGKVPRSVARLAPLGQLTYSIYMIHGIVLIVVVNAIGDKLLKLSPLPLTLLLIVAVALILLISLLSYKLFETPARRWIDGLALFGPTARGGQG